jgi:hypothetical protein
VALSSLDFLFLSEEILVKDIHASVIEDNKIDDITEE